jgi:hypothetical protein
MPHRIPPSRTSAGWIFCIVEQKWSNGDYSNDVRSSVRDHFNQRIPSFLGFEQWGGDQSTCESNVNSYFLLIVQNGHIFDKWFPALKKGKLTAWEGTPYLTKNAYQLGKVSITTLPFWLWTNSVTFCMDSWACSRLRSGLMLINPFNWLKSELSAQ